MELDRRRRTLLETLTKSVHLSPEDMTSELMDFTENVNRVFDGIEATHYYKRDTEPYIEYLYKLYDGTFTVSEEEINSFEDQESQTAVRYYLLGEYQTESQTYHVLYRQLMMQIAGIYLDRQFKINDKLKNEININLADERVSVTGTKIVIRKGKDEILPKEALLEILGTVFQTIVKTAVVYKMVMDEGITTK